METKIDYSNINVEKSYLGGIRFETYSSRTYKLTIFSTKYKKLDGKIIYSKTITKIVNGEFVFPSEVTYSLSCESKEYKSIKWLIKSILNKKT